MSHSVTLQLRGRLYSGRYTVARHFVTVSCGSRSKMAWRRGRQPKPIARMLLRQLALEERGGSDPTG